MSTQLIIRAPKKRISIQPKAPKITIIRSRKRVTVSPPQVTVEQALQRFRNWIKNAELDEKSHQIAGMEWCLGHELNATSRFGCRGGIVADEMGLGKTILMLGCIVSNFTRRTLIVLPPALLSQWEQTINKLFGHQPLVYHGHRAKTATPEQLWAAPIVLTTYGMIADRPSSGNGRPYKSQLHQIRWNRLICDEAHHMRNDRTATFKGACKIRARIKWFVTGTPIQNKKSDLYALCALLKIKGYANPYQLSEIIRQHVLRRTKAGVGIKLPPMKSCTVVVPWDSREEEHLAEQVHSQASFSAVTAQNVNEVIQFMGHHPLPILTRARQCCILPQLIHRAMKRALPDLIDCGALSRNARLPKVKTFSKINCVVRMIAKNRNNGKRKLVFSHYRGEIDLLTALLRRKGISADCIDGRASARAKKSLLTPPLQLHEWKTVCEKWSHHEFVFDRVCEFLVPEVLIVQIRTGCEGLNLQQFREIYFTSPHWNPAVEDQAVARSHRIGQNGDVSVFRFVMNGFGDNTLSIDQYSQKVQDKKREIMRLVD